MDYDALDVARQCGIGFSPEESYVFVNTGEDTFVVAEKRLQDVAKELSWFDYEVVASKPGAAFEDERFEHPVYDDKETVAILADFVSMEMELALYTLLQVMERKTTSFGRKKG